VPGPADRDHVSCWTGFAAEANDPPPAAWWIRRSASAFRDGAGVVALWRETAPAAVRAAALADPAGSRTVCRQPIVTASIGRSGCHRGLVRADPIGRRRGYCSPVRYLSRVPQPPMDQLVDDLYYLEGTPPYSRLKLPPMPSAVLILNLGGRFLIGHSGARPVEFADGCLFTAGTRHLEFAYPAFTRSVGVHFKPWGWAPFVGIPGSEVCDLQLAVEQVWGRYGEELRDELDAASTPG
jgi:hypothetical protein